MDFTLILVIILLVILVGSLHLIYSLKAQLNRNDGINLEDQLRNISNDVLLNNQKHFMNLAKETFDKMLITGKSDLSKKQDDFISIVDPIKDYLNQFNEKINSLEKERISSYSDLKAN